MRAFIDILITSGIAPLVAFANQTFLALKEAASTSALNTKELGGQLINIRLYIIFSIYILLL